MNKYILKSTLALAVIMMASSCETTDYNDTYFGDDGYDSKPAITDVQTLTMTLTSADYAAIAANATNVYNAEKLGLEDELAAVATNECFSDNISGADYIPAYLDALYGTYLSAGSRANVTYNASVDAPEELSFIMAGTTYTVSDDDYASVWGEDVAATYFTPSVSAESNLPTILKSSLPDAEAGDYALVTYAYSATEPSTGGAEEEGGEEEEPLVQGFGDFMVDASTVTITETDGTFVVNGIPFEYVGLSQDSSYGTIYIESTVSGYIKNTAAISGLQEIIIEGNGYVKTNIVVYAGATADSLEVVESVSDAGSGWGSFYSYIMPEGTQFVKFGIPDGATYDASLSGIEFNVAEDFSINSTTVAVTDADGSFTVNGISFDHVGLTQDASYGTIYIESTVSGYIKNTTAMPGLQEVIIEGNGYVKTNLLVTVGATADDLTELVSVSDAGSGWGSFYSYIIPEGTEFISFGIPDEATHDASLSGIDFIFGDASSASAPAKASAAVVTSTLNAVYQFDGSAWSAADNTVMLSSADYTAMGSTYGNLSGTQPETLVPIYLGINYPYAVEGDYIDVVYKFYDGSTYYKASRFNKEGSDWVMENNVEVVVDSPFECMESGWNYNPSMTITFLPTTNDFASAYYQTAIDIISAEYGSDSGYISSYGNTEYFSGCSSYYNNLSWRYDYILNAWTAAGVDFTPYAVAGGADNIKAMYAQLEANLASTFAKMLAVHHPDVEAASGMDVLYTVQYFAFIGKYDNDLPSHEMVFKVSGKGEFEFVEINVLQSAYDYLSDENITYVLSTYGV
ncbi:MAG: hypothetical protein SNI91_02920 [Rikenellaceae bacterium]